MDKRNGGPGLALRVEFEDIEALRREAGIEDAELRAEVRRLRPGDSVRLTAAASGAEPGGRGRLLVLITAVSGGQFRGSEMHETAGGGPELKFRAAHIHSVAAKGAGRTTGPARKPAGDLAKKTFAPTMPKSKSRPQLTTEQRLREIEEMLQRVSGYAEFMCRPGGLVGTSVRSREDAVVEFHERLAALERQLGRVHDEFRLG